MLNWNPQGDYPKVDATSYIDPTAVLIGNVEVGKRVFVGPGAVLRADEPDSLIVIGDDCNVQDRVIIHALKGSSVLVKEKTSLSHGCIIHGPCKIGKNCFIGFGSVVFDAELKDSVFVHHLAVVQGVKVKVGKFIPAGAVIETPTHALRLKEISAKLRGFSLRVRQANQVLVQGYKSVKVNERHEK